MSGGFFNYQQNRMEYLANDINEFLFGDERHKGYHPEEFSNKEFLNHIEDLSWQLMVLYAKVKEVDYILSSDNSLDSWNDESYSDMLQYKTKQEYIESEKERYRDE